MAYGVLYEFRRTSTNGADILITISQRDYEGEVKKRSLGRAPVIKRENNGHIYGTSCELYAECLIDGEFSQLYTSDAYEFRVEVYRNDSLLWMGFVSPELYSEPDVAPPYDVQIIATDGLGELKNFKFEKRGVASMLSHINYLMGKTGIGMALNIVSELRYVDDTEVASADKGVLDFKINLDHEEGSTCYDVLQNLMSSINANITQYNGRYLIFRETDFINKTTEEGVEGFDINGSAVSLPVASFGSMNQHKWWPVGQLSTVIEPAKNKEILRAPNHYKDNVLDFDDWALANSASFNEEEGAYILPDEGSNISQYVDFDGVEVGYRLGLRVRARNVGITETDQSIGIQVEINGRAWAESLGTQFWLRKSGGASTGHPLSDYAWNTKEDFVEEELRMPTDADTSADAQNIDIVIPLYDNANDVLGTFVYANDIKITIFNPAGIHDIYVYDVSLVKYEQIEGYEADVVISNAAREEEGEVELTMSAGDLAPAAGKVFMTGIPLLPSGSDPIKQWQVGDGNHQDYLSVMAYDYSRAIALPKMKYAGVLNVPGETVSVPLLFLRDGTYYFPKTYSYDIYNDELEIELISISASDVSLSSVIISQMAQSAGNMGGLTTSGSGGGGVVSLPRDKEMSDTSDNAVENRVIKAYIDGEVKSVVDLLASMWYLDDDGNVRTKHNVVIEGDTSSGGEGEDTPANGITQEELTQALGNYYTKTEVNKLIDGLTAGDIGLTNYYTKNESDSRYQPLSTAINTGNIKSYNAGGLASVSLNNVNINDYLSANRDAKLYHGSGSANVTGDAKELGHSFGMLVLPTASTMTMQLMWYWNSLHFRTYNPDDGWYDWKQIAFTTSTVAASLKLAGTYISSSDSETNPLIRLNVKDGEKFYLQAYDTKLYVGGGIASAVSITNAGAVVIPSTLSVNGPLTIAGKEATTAIMSFSRTSANYIIAPTGGTINFGVTGVTGIAISRLRIESTHVSKGTGVDVNLGQKDNPWTTIYGKDGNFTGDVVIEGNLIVKGDTSSGGSGEDTDAEGTVTGVIVGTTKYEDVSAGLLNLTSLMGLYTPISSYNGLASRVTTLEGKATAVSFTQTQTSGTKIGSITIDGVAKNIYTPTIPTKLSQFTDDVVSGKYLLLAGGTISGTNFSPLHIKSSTASFAGLGLRLSGSTYSAYLLYKGDTTWAVTGENWIGEKTLIHSGNIESQKVAGLVTPRTIWGQSFDGTGNVDGTLTLSGTAGTTSSIKFTRAGWSYICQTGSTGVLSFNIGDTGVANSKMYILNNGHVQVGVSENSDKGYNFYVNGTTGANGNITSVASDDSVRRVIVKNSIASSSLYVATSGNRGIYDDTNAKWIIYSNGTTTYMPYNDVSVGGSLIVGGSELRSSTPSGGSYPIWRLTHNTSNVHLQAGKVDGTSTAGNLYITGINASDLGLFAVYAPNSYFKGNVCPQTGNTYNLGASSYMWSTTYTRYIDTASGYVLRFKVAGTEYMNLSTAGNLCIGNGSSTGSERLHVYGNAIITGDTSSGSDVRFKDIIKHKTLKIEDIAKAPLFTFKWNDREDDVIHLGSSAQYWEKVCPWLVTGEDFKSLNYATLGVAMGISLAKKAVNHEERIKELEKEIKRLKEEIKYA